MVLFILILLIFTSIYEIAFLNTRTVCGRVIGTTKIRGAHYIRYIYEYKKEFYSESIGTSEFRSDKSLDDLKKMDCIKIECSAWFPSYSRCVDLRVVKNKP